MDDIIEPFGIWPKQNEYLEAIRDSKINGIDQIFMIGPVGSSKTFAMAVGDISVAFEFKDSIIPVGRKDLSEAQIGTWEVYMEALSKMGFRHGKHYTTRQASNDLRIKFNKSGSVIQFIGMNRSRDRDWSKLKITATKASVDEVDDIEKDGFDTLDSRTGRRNDSGAPSVTTAACNPNDGWTKQHVYLPWLKRENRRLAGMTDQEWDEIQPLAKNKMVFEFTMEDSPLYPKGYYEPFYDRSRSWKERYLYNNWNYIDDENALFKMRAMDILTIRKLRKGEKYIGVDPNAGGKDKAAIVLWEGDAIVHAELYTTEMLEKLALPEETSPMNYGAIIGRLTEAMMKREGVGYLNVALDVVGIGQGALTYLLQRGLKVQQYRSGNAPYQTQAEQMKNIKPPYQILRDQVFHKWSMDVDNGRVFFYTDMPHLSSLKKELQLHEADTTAKVMRVTPKDDLKKMLGASPDLADAAVMGYWIRMIRSAGAGMAAGRAVVGKSVSDMYSNSNGF